MDDENGFLAAYDTVLRRWPVTVESVDVPSRYGTTRVQIAGPAGGLPLVLLPGGGTTSVSWFATIGPLAATRRVYAPDLMGDIGRSRNDRTPLRGAGDLAAWLDEVLAELALEEADVCGHSYGAWIALGHALSAPRRLRRLALLDPVACFAGMRPGYLVRALPMLLRPTPGRVRTFHAWETGAAPEDPVWQAFLGSTATARRAKVVAMRRPRAHDARRVAAAARDLLPDVNVVVLPEASHHSLPTERPAELNRLLTEFLA